MKQLLFCIGLVAFYSCNGNDKAAETTSSTTSTSEVTGKGNGEMKDGISDYTNNKESFLLTCRIDASNSLGGEKTEQVASFCECAWEKTKGKYPGEVVATESKVAKDPVLKSCFEEAKTK